MPRRLAAELAARIAAEDWPETVARLTLFTVFCLSIRRQSAKPKTAPEFVVRAVKDVLEGKEPASDRSLFSVLCDRIRRDIG